MWQSNATARGPDERRDAVTSERRAGAEHGARPGAEPATDELEILRLAMSGLPPRQRDAIALAVVHKLDTRAISDRLGIAPSTVQSELRQGLFSLRAVLDVVGPPEVTAPPHLPDA